MAIVPTQKSRRSRRKSAGGVELTPRLFASAGYLIAFLFAFNPLLDIGANLTAFNPGSMAWRYGATGSATNYLVSIVFGFFLAWVIAAGGAQRRALRLLSVLGWIFAIVLIVALTDFVLDTLQLHNVVSPTDMRMFKIGSAKSCVKLVLAAVAMVWGSRVAWRASAPERQSPKQDEATV